MRLPIALAAAALLLAGCQTFDARVQERLPAICGQAAHAHAAFMVASATGYVPPRLVAREAEAWAVMRDLCAEPETATTAEVVAAAVRASATIYEALNEARS